MTADEPMRFRHLCEGLRLAIANACEPWEALEANCSARIAADRALPAAERRHVWQRPTNAWYADDVVRAVWMAKFAVRQARALGLYPTTAQLEAETQRRHAA